MSFEYKGKTSLITGASSGIGKAFAEELAKRGSHLVLVARSKDRLESLAQHLSQAHGVRVQVIAKDLSIDGAPLEVYEAVKKTGEHVHLLINNAGFGLEKNFETHDFERQHQMTLLNVTAVSDLTRLFLPAMLSKGTGGIVNVASVVSFGPMPNMALYGATKAFVLNFTQALYEENRKRGVKVLALCPANTRTEFFNEMGGVTEEELRRMDSPEQVVMRGLNALEQNRSYLIPNTAFKFICRLPRLMPHKLWLRLIHKS